MMHIARALFVLIIAVCIQSCASPLFNQEVQLGKLYFDAGNFRKAFQQLLPAAAGGNPAAQYAVGYMYFYGYGVAQDKEAGLFWMRCAAAKRFIPAMKALIMIEEEERRLAAIPPRVEKERTKEKQTMPSCLVPKKPEPKIPCCVKVRVENRTAPPLIKAEGYGLQLFGAYQLEEVKQLQKSLNLAKQTSIIWHAEYNQRDWYVLIYGHYATVSEARAALKNLPPYLREFHPWIRDVSNLG